jgi:ATP-dependent 26S proteasome regulatory subunit
MKRIPPEQSISAHVAARRETGELAKPLPDGEKDKVDSTQFEVRDPKYRLSDVIMPAVTRDQYSILLSRIRNHDLIYIDWGLANVDPLGQGKAVNFFGPPGTGKTMCAEALAAELKYKILDVSYAEIESKYVGETPKKIRAAFQAASQKSPDRVLLFFDEADAILGRRMTNVTQAADHSVNVSRAVMLKELDRFEGIVVFATNLAKNFDGAFVRRIMQHVPVPLPDADNRKKLWERLIPSRVPGRDSLEWDVLAGSSDGLAGGDIRNAVVLALARAADRVGSNRIIQMADLDEAIHGVQRAKAEIGRDFDSPNAA